MTSREDYCRRGGSWYNSRGETRSTTRLETTYPERDDHIGFRTVLNHRTTPITTP